jgi:hypothetical protein
MGKKNMMNLDWQQAYVLRIRSGFEIEMDADERPNPDVWTWRDGPQRSVKDYVGMSVCGKPLTRHFSPSTKTWYDTERQAYTPSTIDVQPFKPQLKPTRVAKQEEEEQITAAGFSSIETFFQ